MHVIEVHRYSKKKCRTLQSKYKQQSNAQKEEIEQVLALSEEKKQMLRCIYHYYHKWQDFYTRQRQKYKITNQDLMEEGHFSSHTLKRLNDAIYSQDVQNRLRLSIIRILKYGDEEETDRSIRNATM